MSVKLPWISGMISDSIKAAVYLALEKKDDVEFEFNGKHHMVTLAEARCQMPKLLEESLECVESVKRAFDRQFNNAQAELKKALEAYKLL